MKLNSTGSFAQTSEKVLEALYELLLLIAKAKKGHIVGETLLKPCFLKAAYIVLRSENKQKLSQIQLSDNSVKHPIDDMAEDIKNQIDAVKQSPFFAIQLAESGAQMSDQQTGGGGGTAPSLPPPPQHHQAVSVAPGTAVRLQQVLSSRGQHFTFVNVPGLTQLGWPLDPGDLAKVMCKGNIVDLPFLVCDSS
ncbi:hypothetical protein PR048_026817 [Dryococelus australis]|uniref:Uncharacterized protein n=1 Tax=Dryococelus australis TaxID=614101 RepID=A0ABQ9GMC9_9NEOP|nr:hypothetical protein PR048_026817 [Dryococelus australis]